MEITRSLSPRGNSPGALHTYGCPKRLPAESSGKQEPTPTHVDRDPLAKAGDSRRP